MKEKMVSAILKTIKGVNTSKMYGTNENVRTFENYMIGAIDILFSVGILVLVSETKERELITRVEIRDGKKSKIYLWSKRKCCFVDGEFKED